MYYHKNLFVTVSRARVQAGKEKEYLAFRRDEILPQMCAFPGMVYSLLLRDNDNKDTWLLVNAWETKDDLAKWQATDAEAKLRAKAKTILASTLETVGNFTEVHL